VPALAALFLILIASFLPRVEDPIPDRIGLGTVFACVGIGGAFAGVVCSAASNTRRDEAIKWGGVLGFAAGASLYLVSLIVQVASGR
jgi:zinc transporter ZupT